MYKAHAQTLGPHTYVGNITSSETVLKVSLCLFLYLSLYSQFHFITK